MLGLDGRGAVVADSGLPLGIVALGGGDFFGGGDEDVCCSSPADVFCVGGFAAWVSGFLLVLFLHYFFSLSAST